MDLTFEGMRIIRTLAFALRHNPGQFGLDLDPEGWTSINPLVEAFRFIRYDWALLDWPQIEAAIRGSDRFEIRDGKIRAAYGHSIALANPPGIATPPEVLFHGTARDNVPSIQQHGILKMTRQFAHFSSDHDWVIRFLSDKPQWAIFAVHTKKALEAGIVFRKANYHVWLTERMDPQFLVVHSSN